MSPTIILVTIALLSAVDLSSCSLTAGTHTLTGSLMDTGCYAPKADGGWGFCGPLSCKDSYITCTSEGGGPATVGGVTGTYTSDGGTQYSASNCQSFLARTTDADRTNWNPSGSCQTCTQQTTGVCNASFLASVLKGSGVKYAFCNDKWLVISASGEPSVFTANLNDVPFPPGKQGTDFRTGMATLDTTRTVQLFYPLSVTDLSTATGTNNQAVYDTQTGVGQYSFLKDGSTIYGLPSDGASGMAVNGEDIFPIYNNNAKYTPEKCEVDSCSNHVGQGGGQPHFHGDPFGDEDPSSSSPDNCLYGPSDYSNGTSGHPPIIGFSNDGHLIYGRYLSTSAPGFAAPLLDACGGHGHTTASIDDYGFDLSAYHYHTQVFDATCPTGAKCAAGDTYKASTTGPFQCFKADLTQSEGSSALLVATASASYKTKNEMNYRCCGMTDYYALNGVSFNSNDVASSSTCQAPSAPSNGDYVGTSCATAGSTLYSGNTCIPNCGTGFKASGTTRCVNGVLTEIATCVVDGSSSTSSTTAIGASSSVSSSTETTSTSATSSIGASSSVSSGSETTSTPSTSSSAASGSPSPSPTTTTLGITSGVKANQEAKGLLVGLFLLYVASNGLFVV